MPTRPNLVPTWATDTNYTNPPAAGTATKVDPGATKRAEGWRPTELPPAQYENWVKNQIGTWLQHLQDLNIANYWPVDMSDLVTSGGMTEINDAAFSSVGDGSSGPLWVCVGDGTTDRIGTSVAGDTWTSQTEGSTDVLQGVHHNGSNLWCAVGFSEMIYTSPDGATWTSRAGALGGSDLQDVWHDQSGLWIAVGNNTTNVESSPDGINWTARAHGTGANLFRVHHNGSLWVAVGAGGAVSTSPDGLTWTSRTSGTTRSLYGITYDAVHGRWIAVGGFSGQPIIITSADGITWATTTLTGHTDRFSGVFCDGAGNAIAPTWEAANTPIKICHSADGGLNWRVVSRFDVMRYAGGGIVYGDGLWLLIGDGPQGTSEAYAMRTMRTASYDI